MLGSAFLEKQYDGLSKNRMRRLLKGQNNVWSYIGRFISGFAQVEYQVNQLCSELLGGSYAIMLTYTLDMRKKLDLIKVVLESQGIDASGTLKQVHKLHDLRNIIAHWPFWGDADGLSCDFINKEGETHFRKPKTSETDNSIKYSEFDSYDFDASELYQKLCNLTDLVTPIPPITDVSDTLRHNIEEAISSSDNIVRFPGKLKTNDDKGEPGQ